ncbi:signal peptidase I [Inquilinus limosus]|uniref:Signal peptidase I n=1 Tax=Inquilinus limosus TaxID=171674 RepID=A0A211ZT23_9PROT|nr:signal peptidase I [Inquilinus limosus]OWJ68237.1 signal peptidase I [Inquilinus limosus]
MMRRREAIGAAGTALLTLSAGRASAASLGDWLDSADMVGRFLAAGIPAKSYAMGSSSMMPTLGEKDVILADLRMAGALPGRGDIIVFRPPGPDTVYCKRVIGLPGDRVALKGGRLVLNGKIVERQPQGQTELALSYRSMPVSIYEEVLGGARPYRIAEISDTQPFDEVPERVVPADAVFVLGDNRDNSLDSRSPDFGPVPVGNIIGRAVYRLRPNSGWLVPQKSVPGLD